MVCGLGVAKLGARGLAPGAGTKREPRRWRDGLRGAPARAPGASAGHLRRPQARAAASQRSAARGGRWQPFGPWTGRKPPGYFLVSRAWLADTGPPSCCSSTTPCLSSARAWRPWTWSASALTGARTGPASGRPRRRTRVTPGWNCGWPLTGTRSSACPRAGSIGVTTITADRSWRPRDVVRLQAPGVASVPRPGWRKRALAVRGRGRWRTARGLAPRRTGTAAGGALAACAAVCVAVIAAVTAGRDVSAWHGHPRQVTSGRGEPGRLVRRCR